MIIPSIANIIEEIIKIILIIIFLPLAIIKSNIHAIIIIILFNIITETSSIILMQIRISKNYLKDNKSSLNKKIIKDINSISIPTTMVRLITSLGFFLEPIILTNILTKNGISYNFVTIEYGLINSYIIPLLSMPSFFSISIASALLPNITKAYYKNNKNEFNNKLLKLLVLSIITGLFCLIFILLFPKQILNILYGINKGINYIYFIAPFFLIVYMQPALTAGIQAMNKTKKLLRISIISMIIKYTSLIVLSINNFGIYALLYSMIIGIVTTTIQELYIVIKENKKI